MTREQRNERGRQTCIHTDTAAPRARGMESRPIWRSYTNARGRKRVEEGGGQVEGDELTSVDEKKKERKRHRVEPTSSTRRQRMRRVGGKRVEKRGCLWSREKTRNGSGLRNDTGLGGREGRTNEKERERETDKGSASEGVDSTPSAIVCTVRPAALRRRCASSSGAHTFERLPRLRQWPPC